MKLPRKLFAFFRAKSFRFLWIFLLIEFLDELVYGVREAAWPLIKEELDLSYTEIGLLLSLPPLFGNLLEPLIGLLSDAGFRRHLIIGGGVCFAITTLSIGLAPSFFLLLLAFLFSNPASGAFVSLSQAKLMDLEPSKREINMARWELAGTIGNLIAPLLLTGILILGREWRHIFLGLSLIIILVCILLYRTPRELKTATSLQKDSPKVSLWKTVKEALQHLKSFKVLRWLLLLECSDLMLDIFQAFLTLYLFEIAGLSETTIGLWLTAQIAAGLLGNFFLLAWLKRFSGLTYLRISTFLTIPVFIGFLIIPVHFYKLILLIILGLLRSGWYAILKGHLYHAIPGKSGTVMAVSSVSGFFGGLLPLGLGIIAQHSGLETTLWLLLIGPLMILFGLPQKKVSIHTEEIT